VGNNNVTPFDAVREAIDILLLLHAAEAIEARLPRGRIACSSTAFRLFLLESLLMFLLSLACPEGPSMPDGDCHSFASMFFARVFATT